MSNNGLNSAPVPEGFTQAEDRGPFTSHNGPTYRKTGPKGPIVGLRILERHCNSMGFLHGGMAASFTDGAMAWAVWQVSQKMSVTLKLTVEYFETGRMGDWLEAHARAVPGEDGLVYASADLMTNGELLVGRADGVFRTLRRRPKGT